jgi:hypothetical protein
MSQISPTSQSVYSGGMPSGAATYASPTIPSSSSSHEGMSTTDKILITGGGLITAGLIGFGIYRFTKKDKPSGKETSATSNTTKQGNGKIQVDAMPSHGTRSDKKIEAFFDAIDSNNIRDIEHSFKSLDSRGKFKIIHDILNYTYTSDALWQTKLMFFTFENGHLSPELDQLFNRKAEDLLIDKHEIDFKQEISHLKSLSDDDQLSELTHQINEMKLNNPYPDLIGQKWKNTFELYYDKLLRPVISQATHEKISKLAEKELRMNFR